MSAPEAGTVAGWEVQEYPEQLAVVALGPGAEVPAWAESSSLFAVTATAAGTTVVCAGRNVPAKAKARRHLTGFAVRRGDAPSAARVLVDLLVPLDAAGIDAFVVSTHDTDWLLVPKGRAAAAADEWRRRGHSVAPAVPVTPTRKGKQ